MPKGVFVVLTSASTPEEDAAFNEWYTKVHLPRGRAGAGNRERAAVQDGFAQTTDDATLGSDEKYLAIYELDGDFQTVAEEIPARATEGTFTMTDTIRTDPLPKAVIYEEI